MRERLSMLNVKTTAAPRDRLAVLLHLLGRHAVLPGDVLAGVLALGPHAGVQLEGLEVQRDGHLGAEALQRGLERGEADGAPRAGDIGDEIDLHARQSRTVARFAPECGL